MSEKKVIIRGLTKAILTSLGTGAVIGLSLTFPGVGIFYKEFKKAQWEGARKRGSLRGTIKRLEQQALISWREFEGKTRLELTEKGKNKVLEYTIEDLTIKKQKKWDGLFRVIIFDIPEEKRKAREVFRERLKNMGFYQIQRSVFLHPYECKDEIDFLRHNLEISPYVHYILAKEVSNLQMKF